MLPSPSEELSDASPPDEERTIGGEPPTAGTSTPDRAEPLE